MGQRRIEVGMGRAIKACKYSWSLRVRFFTYVFLFEPHSNPAVLRITIFTFLMMKQQGLMSIDQFL